MPVTYPHAKAVRSTGGTAPVSKPGCVVLDQRGIVRLTGPDARSLLQGLVSNDLELLTPAQAIYAALLTPQGKYLVDFLLYQASDAILLDAEAARLAALIQRLTMYRLRAQVAIENAADALTVLAVFGHGAAERLGLTPVAGAARIEGGALLVVDPRLPELGVRVVLPKDEVDGFMAAHGLAPAPFATYDLHRLALGVPDGSRDLIVDKSLLLESGFEELNGVSFTKGCFVGQELTARTKHRALVKKRLMPVRVDGPLPEPGTQVTRGGRDAGEIRSGAEGLAMALLRLEHLAPNDQPLLAGGALLTPAPPVWLPLQTAG
jgi:folate-binding protein YgfZ